jgi:hypothetical protein
MDENSDEETTIHRPPRKRQERKTADPVDKTIPRAIAGQLPATSENPSTLYLHAPQNSDRLQYNGKPLCYPENYTAYLKFPQDYNFLPNQRNIVREMWNRCFYGKDYAGALTCLKTLSEIEYVHAEDLEKLLDILEHANLPSGFGLDGAILLFQQHLQVMSDRVRGIILKSFIRLLLVQDDVKNAKNILRRFRTDTSGEQQVYFLVCDALLSCYQLVKEAESVIAWSTSLKEQLKELPIMGEIFFDPLLFYFPVKFLYHLSKGHLNETVLTDQSGGSSQIGKFELEKRKLVVSSLLQEAHRAFVMTRSTLDVQSMVDFQLWQAAFLLGFNMPEQVLDLTKGMLQNAEQFPQPLIPHHKSVIQQICNAVSRMITLFSPLSMAGSSFDPSLLQDLIIFQMPSISTSSAEALQPSEVFDSFSAEEVYQHWFRCFYGLESINCCLRYLSNYVEYHTESPLSLYEHRNRWMVWKMLASLLGPLPTYCDDWAPIDIRHPVGYHIPEIVYANQLYANIDHQEYLHSRLHSQVNNGNKNSRYPSQRSCLLEFREQCQWWLESVLSVSQLDDFSNTLIEQDMEEVLEAIDEIRKSKEKAKNDLNSSFLNEGLYEDENVHLDITSFETFLPPQSYSEVFNHPFEYWQRLREHLSALIVIPDYELEDTMNETVIHNTTFNLSSADALEGKNYDPIVDFGSIDKRESSLFHKPHSSVMHLLFSKFSTTQDSSQDGEDWLPFGPQFDPLSKSLHGSTASFIQELLAMILNRTGSDHSRIQLHQFSSISSLASHVITTNMGEIIEDGGGMKDLIRKSEDILSLYYEQMRKGLSLPFHRFSLTTRMVDAYQRPVHALCYSSAPLPGQPTYRQVYVSFPFQSHHESKNNDDGNNGDMMKEDIDVPSHQKNSRNKSRRFADIRQRQQLFERMRCYDSGDLEQMTFQALVAAHLLDQDNYYTVRVVQILCHHVLRSELVNDNESTATECLVYLAINRINLRRCIAKGLEFACRNIPVDQAPPSFFLNGKSGPLRSREFEEEPKTSKKDSNSAVNSATEPNHSLSLKEIVAEKRKARQKEREQMMTIYRDTAHEIELIGSVHTFYDPIQFEPRKAL